jgi:hypothetical protein
VEGVQRHTGAAALSDWQRLEMAIWAWARALAGSAGSGQPPFAGEPPLPLAVTVGAAIRWDATAGESGAGPGRAQGALHRPALALPALGTGRGPRRPPCGSRLLGPPARRSRAICRLGSSVYPGHGHRHLRRSRPNAPVTGMITCM